MNMLKTFLAGLAALSFSFVAAPAALAQDTPVILFIDQTKLVGTSKAGISISNQIKKMAEDAEKEVSAEGKKIEDEGKRLQDSKDSLSKEDFGKRYQALLVEAQKVNQLGQIKKAEIAQSEAKAINELNEQLRPIVKDILDKRNATVLLERRAVMFADEEMDITDEIVKALDRKVKTIKVEKVDLIAQAEAARKAQQ